MSVEKMYASDREVQRTLPKWTLRIKAKKSAGAAMLLWSVSRTFGRRSLLWGRVTVDVNSANVFQVWRGVVGQP